MKKVTSNVQLEKYSETPAVQYYKGTVKLGEEKSDFLLEAHRSGEYNILLDTHDNYSEVIEAHQMPVNFLTEENEDMKVARIARTAFARALRGEFASWVLEEGSPFEILIDIEFGIHDSYRFYNYHSDRVSKRRV